MSNFYKGKSAEELTHIDIVQNSMVLRTDQNFFRVNYFSSKSSAFNQMQLRFNFIIKKSNHDGDESPIHKSKLGYGVIGHPQRKAALSL